MAVIRCAKGHYYDDQRFSLCPHCGVSGAGSGGQQSPGDSQRAEKKGIFGWLDREKTVAFSHEKEGEPEKKGRRSPVSPAGGGKEDSTTVALEAAQEDDQRTVGYFSGAKGNDYVTGWLVCVEGPGKGRDYRLHHGFNRIGRSCTMDVQVLEDPAVTRENHCSVVYDNKGNRFSVIPSSGALTYYNGQLLTGPEILESGDEISMGNSRFAFIPFCREGNTWEKEDGQ